ncbi:MAG: hypothetical protein KZQ86_01820 [Candidatus Thiodiazotropha sp. (ex Lucinoma kastoroae)]|nr:hypothetical protein [Candidatus Thiodiazotropha sp. (ex Lucinoma kastoroae)]
MSGPKVVRIVTEEERIAICETQIALLTAAIQSLLYYLNSHEIKVEKLEANLTEKLEHYKKLATPDKYREIPGMIQRELDYISFELDRHRDIELEKARSRRRRIRTISESIKTLQMLASGSVSGVDPNACLKHSELCDKSDAELSEIEQNISSELSELSNLRKKERADGNLTAEQKETRDRLISAENEVSVSEWKLVSAELDKGDDKRNRIDTVMAELDEMEFPEFRKIEYQGQLDSIYEENSGQQRALLLDSLVIDLAKESRGYKRMQKARHDLLVIKAQINALKEEDAKLVYRQIDKALESENISVLENMLEAATGKLAEIITARSVEHGREALIDALKSLGYGVSEGMETAVVENGRLVVKKPAEEVYGVEVQTIAATGKFQLRLISGLPDNERSTKDDVAEEERWCDDLAKIRKSLAESGVDLELEKALDPGAVAVRHSATMTKMLERERRISQTGRRELDR